MSKQRYYYSRRTQNYSNRSWSLKPKDITGERFYVFATVKQVKRIVGHLAKKIRISARGNVEVIHTSYRNWLDVNRIMNLITRAGFKWSHYDKDL